MTASKNAVRSPHMPTIKLSNVTDQYIKFFRGWCSYCYQDFIYVQSPDWAFKTGLPNQILVDAALFMDADYSEHVSGETFCSNCNLSIMPGEIAEVLAGSPEYVVVSGRVVEVEDDTPTESADEIDVIPPSHIVDPAIRFYSGECTKCFEEFIYHEKSHDELKVPEKTMARLECLTGNPYGKVLEGTTTLKDGKPVWECPKCSHLLMSNTQFITRGWGSLTPIYAFMSDGYLYEVKSRTGQGSEDSTPQTTYKSRYTGRSYSYSSYDDDWYGYGSYSYKTPEERLAEISDLVVAGENLRPRPSSAGKQFAQPQQVEAEPLTPALPAPSVPKKENRNNGIRQFHKEWGGVPPTYQELISSEATKSKFRKLMEEMPEEHWDDALQILTIYSGGMKDEYSDQLIKYLEEANWIVCKDKYWSRIRV